VIILANVASVSRPVTLAASSRSEFRGGGDVARWEDFGELKRYITKRPRTFDYASPFEPRALCIGFNC
jgi:hypothetical protein